MVESTGAGAGGKSIELQACAIACLVGLVTLALAGILQSHRSLWQDESMLLANFGLSPGAYFHSLPFYDQAGPPFALLTLDGVFRTAGETPALIRQILLAINTALLAAFAMVAWRRDDRSVLLAIGVVAATPLTVRYAVEIKQYVFELQAAFAFLLALRWWPTHPVRVMILTGVLSFFSFSMMLVVGVATLDAVLFRFDEPLRRRWFGLLVLYSVAWLVSYVLLFRPAVAQQIANYPEAYQRMALTDYLHRPALFRPQLEAISKAQPFTAIVACIAAILAICVLSRGSKAARTTTLPRRLTLQSWQPARVLTGLYLLIGVMWLAGYFPIISSKHFLFMMPIGAMVLAETALGVCAIFASPFAPALMLTALIVPSAAFTAIKEWKLISDFQDSRGLYEFVKGKPGMLILPEMQFEPTLRYYMAHDAHPPRRVAGLMGTETVPMLSPPDAIRALDTDLATVAQHIYVPLYRTNTYPVYARWLLRQMRGTPEAIVAAVQFDASDPTFVREAARYGCRASIIYRSRDAVAFHIACPARGPGRPDR